MICPNCGLKQRETSECLQCQMPLQGAKKKDEKQISEKQTSATPATPVPAVPKSDPPKMDPPTKINPEIETGQPKIGMEEIEKEISPPRIKIAKQKEVSQRQAEKLGGGRPGRRPEPEPEPPPLLEPPAPAILEEETMVQETPSAPEEKPARKPSKEPGRVADTDVNADPDAEKKILVTTTQKIEGKRIKGYYGLITANILVELDDPLLSGSDRKMTSMTGSQSLKTGILRALKDLRSEAAQYGANAVIATSLHFQKIDSQSFLLSAVGTAVLAEEPK